MGMIDELCDNTDAELARLRQERDALAAENRVMRGAVQMVREITASRLRGMVFAHKECGCDMSVDSPCEDHLMHSVSGDALSQRNTASEVERVKTMEAVVEATPVLLRLQNQIIGQFDAPEDVDELESFFAALDKLK